jgi:hypothetical protein
MEDSTVLEQEVETANTFEEAGSEVEVDETVNTVEDTDIEESGGSENEVQDDQDAESNAELLEFDFSGNKLQVPKGSIPEELAAKVQEFSKSMESAHTKRSQAVAEQVKSLEAREKAMQKLSGLHGETLDTYSKGLKVREELEQLNQVDITELWQSNPDRARQVSDTISAKQAEFNAIVNKVSQQEQATTQVQEQEVARRYQEGKASVNKRVPDFETKHAKDVIEYVTSTYGIPKEHAQTWPLNPPASEMAYKAMLYDRLQSNAKKQTKITPVKAEPVKAVATGRKPGQNSVKPNDKDSTKEWLRKRNAQLRKQGGR